MIKLLGKTKIEGKTIFETGPQAPAFAPTDISGLQLWLDAADSSTLYNATVGGSLVTTDGSAVARWADKSGNNRHATQTTANARPLLKTAVKNGRNGLRFDGTNDSLSCGDVCDLGTNSAYMFVVARYLNSAGGTLLGKSRASGLIGRYFLTRAIRSGNLSLNTTVAPNGSTAVDAFTQDTDSTNYRLINGQIKRAAGTSASSVLLKTNGTLKNSVFYTDSMSSYNTTDLLFIGAYANSSGSVASSSFINADICEVLLYITPSFLSETSITNIEAYLNTKWALY